MMRLLHEDRVVAEKTQLDDRLERLTKFLVTEIYAELPSEEQVRLKRQKFCMEQYSETLGERIAAFKP